MSAQRKPSDAVAPPPVVYRGPQGTFRMSPGQARTEAAGLLQSAPEAPAYLPPPLPVPRMPDAEREPDTERTAPDAQPNWEKTTNAALPPSIVQSRTFEPGAVVAGTEIVELIDEGGFAEIYRARDLESGAMVALKVLQRRHAHKIEVATRMMLEARFLCDLTAHRASNVVRVLRVTTVEGIGVVIVMELLRGRPLRYLMSGRRMAVDDAISTLIALAEAIAQLHDRTIFHRDLKPENVFMERTDDGLRLVLIDLGCAKGPGSPRTTEEIQTVGTPAYVSPEQISQGHLTERSDQYSFGVIAYEMLEGHHMHRKLEERSPGASMLVRAGWHLYADVPTPKRMPAAAWRIVARTLARQDDRRYPSMVEVARELRAVLAKLVAGALAADELAPPIDMRTPSGPQLAVGSKAESALPKMVPQRVPSEQRIDKPSLFVVAGPENLVGSRFAIGREVLLGRRVAPLGSREPLLTLDAETVSQSHARLTAVFADVTSVTYGVYDLGSRNGVEVSRIPVKEGIARPGTILSLGEVDLLVLGPNEVAPPLEEFRRSAVSTSGTRIKEGGSMLPMLPDDEASSSAHLRPSRRNGLNRLELVAIIVGVVAVIALALIVRAIVLGQSRSVGTMPVATLERAS